MIQTIDNTLTPIVKTVRIQALDVIRGLSILGILAVNADGFAAPITASLNPVRWPFPNIGLTAVSYWVVDTFFHDKFVTLFSMLFGVSLFLVGGERSDKARSRILWRRLAVLFAFAMLHGFGIWWGDILSLYACTGVIMFFCRSWTPRTLLMVGVVLYTAMALRQAPTLDTSIGRHLAPTLTARRPAEPIQRPAPEVAAAIQEAGGSWAGAYRANTRSYLHVLSGDPWLVPSTLGLMMAGLSLFKSGFLSARSSQTRYLGVLALGAPALVVIGWLTWRKDVLAAPLADSKTLELLLAPFVSLAYAGALILLMRTKLLTVLSPLAATGRMAFTNYLTQSLIMTSVFYGGRGGLMGTMDRPTLWVLVFGVWILQLSWSPLWLARFDMGPFEWAWRCLTLARRVPLLKPR